MGPSVRDRVLRIPVMAWCCLGVGVALCLVAGIFIWYEQTSQYDAGYEYGESSEIISVHVFDGDFPGGDMSYYEDLAEQECAEHSADDDAGDASPKWLEGCVDAVLRR